MAKPLIIMYFRDKIPNPQVLSESGVAFKSGNLDLREPIYFRDIKKITIKIKGQEYQVIHRSGYFATE